MNILSKLTSCHSLPTPKLQPSTSVPIFSLTTLEHLKRFCNSVGALCSLQIPAPAHTAPFPFLLLIHQAEAYFPFRSLVLVRSLLGHLLRSYTSSDACNAYFLCSVSHLLVYLFLFQTIGSYFLEHSCLRDTVKAKGPPPIKVKIYMYFLQTPRPPPPPD